MFKIKAETRVILSLLRKSVLNNLLGGAVVRFGEKGVITSSSFGTYGCFVEYTPAHFEEYLIDYTTDIRVNQSFIKNVEEMGFQSDEICQIESDLPNNRLLIVSGNKRWQPNIPNPAIETIGLSDSGILLTAVEGVGYLPNTKRPPLFQVRLNAEKISIPRSGDFITFYPQEKSLKLSWDMDGPAEVEIPLIPEEISLAYVPTDKAGFTFHLSYLKSILSNLSGEITMTIYERSIVFNQVTANMKSVYFIATI